ncbi:hypothetical protein [Azospirillum argentinense]
MLTKGAASDVYVQRKELDRCFEIFDLIRSFLCSGICIMYG